VTADDDIARERYLSIQRLARDLGRPTDELLVLYVMEGFIARSSESVYSEQLVLKGGMLMSTFAERRPTRDIDLQALGISNDTESLKEVTVQIASIDHMDGIDFKTETTSATVIRDQAEYSGIRVAMEASIHSANLRLKIDFSVGDPISPVPTITRIESVLPGSDPITILSFPITMVLAEKIATAASRGIANTRWRDFADILSIAQSNEIDGSTMYESLRVVAEHRKIELRPLAEILTGFSAQAQPQWVLWLGRQSLEDQLPDSFDDVLDRVAAFADPAILNKATGQNWSPVSGWQHQIST
jgi:nucleotidyltransferase AbiEii toxin of type IV toxin-antitoxin system